MLPTDLQVMKAIHMDVHERADALYTLLRHIQENKRHVTAEQSRLIYERRAVLLESRDKLHEHVLKSAVEKDEVRKGFDRQILQIVETQIGKIDSLMQELQEYIPTPQQPE